MEAIRADEALHTRPNLSPDSVYQLTLLATGDKREAAQAKADATEARSRAKFEADPG